MSQKAQALIALVATSDHLRRTRTWLQDKLWSDSDSEKSSANLRQALTTIRKALGEHAAAFQANRPSVWLDKSLVDIDWQPNTEPPVGQTFLEGIDIADPEFSIWLSMMRAETEVSTVAVARGPVAETQANWRLALITDPNAVSTASHLQSEFVSLLARNFSEYSNVAIQFEPIAEPDSFSLEVQANAVGLNNGDFGLRLAAMNSLTRRVFWNQTAVSSGTPGPIEKSFDLLGLSFQALTAVGKEVGLAQNAQKQDAQNSFLLGSVLPDIFSFRPEKLDEAENVLKQVGDERLSATMLGWRAQISVIRLIERFPGETEDFIGMGKMLAAKAMEADSLNSMALATAANANVLLDWDTTTGAELAGLAIRSNPSNPFGWWAYSNVALYCEEPEKALKAAQIAEQLAGKTTMQFWCKFQLGLAALQCGKLELARRSLETSAALSPRFRPPKRYLLALYLHDGDMDRAERVANQLKELEPDFTIDKFLKDPDYPVSLARSAGLIGSNTSGKFLDLK